MSRFRQHFFVCTNQRPPVVRPSCGVEGAPQILIKLKEEIEKRGLLEEVKITASGCLGPCEDGPAMVVYPEATWYKNVSLDDVDEIVEQHVMQGKPVERLLFHWPENTP